MRAYLKAALIASTAMGFGAQGWAQSSSSPFSGLSGLFSGGSEPAEGPVSLDIRVAGDDEDIAKAVRNTSQIKGALDEGRTTGQDVLAAARADYARILGVLYDKGHYDAVINILLDGVEAAEIAPLDAPSVIRQAVIVVDPGSAFTFSRAAIAPVAPKTELPAEYKRGEIAGTGTIKSAATAGVQGWRDAGYAKANVGGQEIIADHTERKVDSQIALAPGPAVTFGKLNISGYERMDPRRLRKIAGFPEGERFDPEEIETVRKRLRRSGVFSAITLQEADDLGPGNTMDVDLTVVEEDRRRMGAGVELSNTDGALVSAYWMHRNLLGGGERLRVDGELRDIGSNTSGRDEELTIRLERPATVWPDATAYIESKAAREREEDYKSDSGSLALGFNYIFSDRFTADAALLSGFSRVYDANGKTDFKILGLPMDVTWDQRDDMTDAKNGYYLSGDVTPFKGFDGTDSGVHMLGEGRGFYSVGADDRLTFAGRARFGTVLGAEIARTPRDFLFYSGGGDSVRGQPYESLGVYEIQGPDGPIKTGGMSLANLSTELRWQFREKIGLVAFADFGEVWTEHGFTGESESQSGAGIGVRYKTPIGPLRFDVAGPTGGNTGNGMQVYLGLGQAF